MNFKQYLEEGRDSPLFHGTPIYAAEKIIKENKLDANFTGYNKNFISFSRIKSHSFYVAREIHDTRLIVIFELDQRKLAQRHKIVPFNFSNKRPGIGDRTPMFTKIGRMSSTGTNEFEETIKAPINDLKKYIKRIYIRRHIFDEYSDDKTYKLLMNHPKLYIE
ncbi:MAG: hypothetical protein COA52_01040 [Hyphomicrobiales bacterium]|nr:MAG: hypothetical protein COA52_01040 [Hyphomicrobiales bacterium]